MKKDSNQLDSKIQWVCHDCAMQALALPENKGKSPFLVSTYHVGKCDVCGHKKAVTQTRDFMFPVFEIEDR